jgi:hypothetical protein
MMAAIAQPVIPAKAGIAGVPCRSLASFAPVIPASAGMTKDDGE